jgi:hypothetical protein
MITLNNNVIKANLFIAQTVKAFYLKVVLLVIPGYSDKKNFPLN